MCYDADMTDDLQENGISGKTEALALTALLAVGFALRLAGLGALPAGLNQDEASALYDAWAILNYGIDRCGVSFSVLLEAWGSGQNALLSYLSMPFIALFGLSAAAGRMVPALFGCVSLAAAYLLARRARGPRAALWVLFFLDLCPWHIMVSRWALESNLLPALLLFGIYFVSLARDRPWALLPAALCFALSPYAYGTAFFFLPPFLVFALVWLRRELRPAPFFVSLGAFALIVLPIALCQIRNVLGLPAMTLFGLTLPSLTETRQSATSVLGGGGLAVLRENLRAFLAMLITQSDGLPYNCGPRGGGIFYIFGLPLAVIGLGTYFASPKSERRDAPMLAALCTGCACAPLIDVNINRLNMLWLPLIYFAGLGLYQLAALLKKWIAVPALCVLAAFAVFFSAYAGDFGGDGYTGNFPGLGDAIEYVEARSPESAFISYYVNQPYIFVLFYTETPPQEFIDTAEYLNPGGDFRWVRSFGVWRFGLAEEAGGEYLILHGSEVGERHVLARFGEYVVCAGHM